MGKDANDGQVDATGRVLGMSGVAILAVVLLAVVIMISFIVPPLMDRENRPTAEMALSGWLVVGSVVLLVVLMAVALLSNFVIGNRSIPGPLGMPEGSVSAVIALMLLLIFAITSIYLFSQLQGAENNGRDSSGVTSAVLQGLPQDRILELRVENPAAPVADRTYTVKLSATNRVSVDFAQATSLTIGTLLTAVAGFYFGQRATQSGIKQAKDIRDGQRSKAQIDGKTPQDMAVSTGKKNGEKTPQENPNFGGEPPKEP